ncbi:hypothetical protein [Pollutimonas bauzanensis]|uniref:Uncharacterized protein n=1 Tax=Pollutimonas bauzanensis TaxID=658167 RepID=A0A1M5MST1_9BURK|nr:hypothetical protein [Pollutimonas bauzanensis]SHG80277.1 hypothetical protein SAMN04488135_101309 [Pollutimonas bauzanensis]
MHRSQTTLHWGWRVSLGLAGGIVAVIAVAWVLARHAPLNEPLERLYVGLFMGVIGGQIVLLAALLAPSIKLLLGRLAFCWMALALLLLPLSRWR